mmetsp:Transcript_5852/g.8585  ORF Transcript_5852/g.8585 Transcript_5852/m.8585 type:complete len:495 (+) Transcript_5852:59-1543(+)
MKYEYLWLPAATNFLLLQTCTSLAPPFQIWRPLPHVHAPSPGTPSPPPPLLPEEGQLQGQAIKRREVFTKGATFASSLLISADTLARASASASEFSIMDPLTSPRSVVSLDSHGAIPVWPSWAGGRVIPISLGNALQEPFLLLAHHDHWFDPRDPLRQPFKAAGKALGLPYVDVEGFSMHPHRGFDILTYILDGSDGFRHRDSMGGKRTYRGGSAQWMRTGSGVLHEEFWETSPDRRTNIELFQLWVNLPASHKFDPPAIHYLGKDTESSQWIEHDIIDPESNKKVGSVRDLGATLYQAIDRNSIKESTSSQSQQEAGFERVLVERAGSSSEEEADVVGKARHRPPVQIMHVTIDPGAQWTVEAPLEQSALIYVRKGSANMRGLAGDKVLVQPQQTATFGHNGGTITVENSHSNSESANGNSQKQDKNALDILLLMATPMEEPISQAGPIVMNTAAEVNDAYQQLEDGTFLNRNYAMKWQQVHRRRSSTVSSQI